MSKIKISDLAITPESENFLQELSVSEIQYILGSGKPKVEVTVSPDGTIKITVTH